ncbi:hypothetical protein BDQ17DRAFT_1251137, partial [Cyathus striatus]
KNVFLAKAQSWMVAIGYHWMIEKVTNCGQYVDGHGQPDVVNYRKEVFLPHWTFYKTYISRFHDECLQISLMQTGTAL